MSNWICDKCGATYIDVSHQEPSVLKQEIEIRKLKQKLSIATKGLQDMADGKIPYTSFGYYAKQILEHIKEQK